MSSLPKPALRVQIPPHIVRESRLEHQKMTESGQHVHRGRLECRRAPRRRCEGPHRRIRKPHHYPWWESGCGWRMLHCVVAAVPQLASCRKTVEAHPAHPSWPGSEGPLSAGSAHGYLAETRCLRETRHCCLHNWVERGCDGLRL